MGFFSLGKDGQVPGSDYSIDALDVGMGLHPELTGQGYGFKFTKAVSEFARTKTPYQLRVTIMAFNQRAQQVWGKLGFNVASTFTSPKFNIFLKQYE